MASNLPLFTLVHVLLSVIGIVAGLVAVGGFASGVRLRGWTALFLARTILTNVTGFGFPFTTLLPSHVVGILSLVVLAVALVALFVKRLDGAWRAVFVVTSVVALYLNVFVLMAQLLQKIPALATIAPDPSAPAFGATQGLVLMLFVALGWIAVTRFRMESRTGLAGVAR